MGNKTLWVRPADEPVWKAMVRLSDQRDISQSRIVTAALERYLPELAAEPDHRNQWDAIAAKPQAA